MVGVGSVVAAGSVVGLAIGDGVADGTGVGNEMSLGVGDAVVDGVGVGGDPKQPPSTMLAAKIAKTDAGAALRRMHRWCG